MAPVCLSIGSLLSLSGILIRRGGKGRMRDFLRIYLCHWTILGSGFLF